jgi:hypothetical protein
VAAGDLDLVDKRPEQGVLDAGHAIGHEIFYLFSHIGEVVDGHLGGGL